MGDSELWLVEGQAGAATVEIDLKIIILSEVAQIQTNARYSLCYVDTSSELSDRCV